MDGSAPFCTRPVVLASGSATRSRLLEAAGLSLVIDPPAVDEDEIKHAFRTEGMPVEATAEALAVLKAERVSMRHPGWLTIGADQILDCEGAWFDKPPNRATARAQLDTLSGRTHRLVTAAAVALDGARIWHEAAEAKVTFRRLSPAFLDAYLDAAGDDVFGSVGAYRMEGLGAQLFHRIQGDPYVVLGLPLLPLLGFLREHGVVTT